MNNEDIFVTKSYQETQNAGKELIKRLNLMQGSTLTQKNALVLALYGDLGSGKTTFVQGLAKGLGIKRRIISPTFIIVRNYEIRFKIYDLKFGNFYHTDLYRVEKINDIKELGVEEIINNPQNIVAIEWAEKMGKLLPEKRVDVYFENLGEEKRKITIKN